MLKRTVCFIAAVTVLCLCGCALQLPAVETTQHYEYEYQTTAVPAEESSEAATEPSTEAVEVSTELQYPSEMQTTLPAQEEETATAEVTTAEESTAVQEPATTAVAGTEVELSLTMPEKNGTMVTDTSADNKYIKIVCDKRGLDSGNLVAVYAVPESGQNYVFEFYNSQSYNSDNIRRVYLINAAGEISGVAAVKSSEREGVSVVENWFCMNVLIKELIFPAVSGDIR